MAEKTKPGKQSAQIAFEYVVVAVVLITGLLTMNVYLKRGIQGRLKSSTDDIGGQFSTLGRSTTAIKTYSHTRDEVFGGNTKTSYLDDAFTNRLETSTYGDLETESWGASASSSTTMFLPPPPPEPWSPPPTE